MATKKYLVRVVKVSNNRIIGSEQHIVFNTSKVKALDSVLSSKDNSWQKWSVDILR